MNIFTAVKYCFILHGRVFVMRLTACSCGLSVCPFGCFHFGFGFGDGVLDRILTIPDHCLFFTLFNPTELSAFISSILNIELNYIRSSFFLHFCIPFPLDILQPNSIIFKKFYLIEILRVLLDRHILYESFPFWAMKAFLNEIFRYHIGANSVLYCAG